jgi:hydroxylamine reductase
MKLFCRQCEQAVGAKACTSIRGVCGKDAAAAALQDLLIQALKAIGIYAKLARDLGIKDRETDRFVIEGLFTTVTNVNFDPQRLREIIIKSYEIKEKIKVLFLAAYRGSKGRDFADKLPEIVNWVSASSLEGLLEQGSKASILDPEVDEDIRSLREILLYGLKGMAAYAEHALILGKEDSQVNCFFFKGLAALIDDSLSKDALLNLIMEFGKINLRCLEILDEAHNQLFGTPVPTKVSLGIKKGPAILVSGHDLNDLAQLLEQTKDRGINIYTHAEMLPAHGYPQLKKYKHLAGHFGGAWQDQQREFVDFPGAILFTTNCIQEPRESYKDRVFTTGLVAWPGVEHILEADGKKDFTEVIEKALELGGFSQDISGKEITVGFGHDALLNSVDKIVEAVKSGKIKHFFLIGGCDGAKPGRNYYTEFAKIVPANCLILTLACGKFRFNKLDFGSIGAIPRLLDCGQCNDAYSAIIVASHLAKVFNCSINELPLSLILSWYEQKAVCILLTLLSLGVKNIKLGPSLPAFISPAVLNLLASEFNISPITNPEQDLQEILIKDVLALR